MKSSGFSYDVLFARLCWQYVNQMSRADICPAPSHVRELVFAAVGDGRDWVSVATPPHAPSFLTPRVQGFLVVRLLFLLLVSVYNVKTNIN